MKKLNVFFVCLKRNKNGLEIDIFDNNWKRLPFKRNHRTLNKDIEKPTNFTKMKELAEKLAKNIDFIRVDFYEINNQIYFGELTFYPGSGFEEFIPNEWDYKLGNLLKID